MKAKTLLGAVLLAAAGVVVSAPPASACITVYLPVIGSVCTPCEALPDDVACPLP